jgi:hypothetical protein
MWEDEMALQTKEFLQTNPALQFVDVSEAAGSTTGNGHSYFHKSLWVSSDLLVLLSYDYTGIR